MAPLEIMKALKKGWHLTICTYLISPSHVVIVCGILSSTVLPSSSNEQTKAVAIACILAGRSSGTPLFNNFEGRYSIPDTGLFIWQFTVSGIWLSSFSNLPALPFHYSLHLNSSLFSPLSFTLCSTILPPLRSLFSPLHTRKVGRRKVSFMVAGVLQMHYRKERTSSSEWKWYTQKVFQSSSVNDDQEFCPMWQGCLILIFHCGKILLHIFTNTHLGDCSFKCNLCFMVSVGE